MVAAILAQLGSCSLWRRCAMLVLLLAVVAKDLQGSEAATDSGGHHPPGVGMHPAGVGHHAKGGHNAGCIYTGISINVFTAADLQKRLTYRSTRAITLVLQNDIVLTSPLYMDRDWSCTVFLSRPSHGVTVSSPSVNMPLLRIDSAKNILMNKVSWSLPLKADSPNCTADVFGAEVNKLLEPYLCPAVVITYSYAIQLTEATINGRVEMLGVTHSRLDALVLRTLRREDYNVRIRAGGMASKLLNSGNVVSNSDIGGAALGIILEFGCVGTTVINNYFHDFFFAGVQVGHGVHNVADAVQNNVSYNYVYSAPGQVNKIDSTGIYLDLHWINPGNLLTCNYIIGGEHCLYLDYASSGVTVDGLVCVNNMNGLKENNGKHNNVTGMLLVGNKQGSTLSCQLYYLNNCANDPGSFWEAGRIMKLNAPAVKVRYPWMSQICQETSVNGVACNPPEQANATASITAKCSGIPTSNVVQGAFVASPFPLAIPGGIWSGCQNISNVSTLNSFTTKVYPGADPIAAEVGFADPANGDFGLLPTSPILADFASFRSCPRAIVGPQAGPTDPITFYLKGFNVTGAVANGGGTTWFY
eukprot:SM000002S05711  [mRNA]  locus=s2:1781162:1784639:- [translate_table: standard]